MLNKIKKYFNSKIKKYKFKKSLKKEKRRLFIDDCLNNQQSFKKRKKVVVKLPNFKDIINETNIQKIYIWIFSFSIISLIILLFSPLLNIKNIDIETEINSKNLIDLNIAYKAIEAYRNKNIFLISEKDIWNSLINYQKNVRKIEINRNFFPPKINIKLHSFDAIFNTEMNWKNYLITKNWVFIQTNNRNILGTKKIVLSLKDWYNDFFEYKKILKEEYIEKIINIEKKVIQNIVWLKVKDIYYYEREREVHFNINNDTKLIFDLNTNTLEEQITKIAIYNKEHKNLISTNSIIYIDLRVPNKIYYCEKENEWACLNNLKTLYNKE